MDFMGIFAGVMAGGVVLLIAGRCSAEVRVEDRPMWVFPGQWR